MNHELLNFLVSNVKKGDDAKSLLAEVRLIVYGDRGFDSPYRIDNFELTGKGLCLSVGCLALGTVYRQRVLFAQKTQLRRVA